MAQTEKQKIGETGENVAVKHFMKHSFKILDRNYRKKWGEIDIIAKKGNVLHFIEVKSVSRTANKENNNDAEDHTPEENVHFWKRQRLAKAIKTYLLEKNVSHETEWQVDVVSVFLDFNTRRARVRVVDNVLLT